MTIAGSDCTFGGITTSVVEGTSCDIIVGCFSTIVITWSVCGAKATIFLGTIVASNTSEEDPIDESIPGHEFDVEYKY
jgi:hypothetical protein